MTPLRRHLLRGLVIAGAAGCAARPGAHGALAQDYPSRPITLVVGFAPGGSADILARLVAQKLSGTLGQQVVVENRPGAGATIASAAVAGAPPDGHTLLLVTSGHAGGGALYAKLPYDPQELFRSRIGDSVRHRGLPAHFRSLADRSARRRPRVLNYAPAAAADHHADALKVGTGLPGGPSLGQRSTSASTSRPAPAAHPGRQAAPLAVASRVRAAVSRTPTVAEQGQPGSR
jgi:tripartite-type tricarboxylate transporter receptor subunit TctC